MSITASEILGSTEERFRLLVDAVQDYAIYLLDGEGRVVTWNTGAERNKGYKPAEIIGQHFSKFFPPEDVVAGLPRKILAEAVATGRFAGEGWRVRKNGTRFWASVVVSALRDAEGNTIGFAKVTRDLTERKQQEEALKASEEALHAERDRLKVTLYSIADGVISTDENGRVTMMNPVAETMSGWKLEEASGRPMEEVLRLVGAEDGSAIKNPVRECLWLNRPIYLQEGVVLIARNGTQYDIQDSVAPIRTVDGDVIGAVLIFQDVTRIRTIQRELAFSATHDPLTLLPNRKMFLEGLQVALKRAKATGAVHSLCFLDLDRFKIINDTAGHGAGDILLRNIADLLTKHFRESDLVARLGGDEFAIILHGCKPEDAQPSLTKLAEAVESLNFHWQEQVFPLSVSIGVASMTPDSDGAGVMKQADVACYAAKHAGRNRISIYREDEGEGHERHQQLKVAADIRDAVAQNRFMLVAQKIMSLASPEAPHYEILMRMRASDGGAIMPAQFIPAAERYGQMADIDRWVMNRVLRHFGVALAANPDIQLSINLSANSLNDPKFPAFLLDLLEKSPVKATAITLEITETSLINNLVTASALIEKVRAIGCKVALDDFGIGVCSFSYLRNFKVDYIKIDGSFIRNMIHSAVDLSIVKAINNIAHEIDSMTIAEFVESEEILEMVRAQNIDFAQGYAIDRPEPLEKVIPALVAR